MEKTQKTAKTSLAAPKTTIPKTATPKTATTQAIVAKTSSSSKITQKAKNSEKRPKTSLKHTSKQSQPPINSPDTPRRISKGRLIAYAVCLVILAILMVISLLMMANIRRGPQNWIDCQPPLSELEQVRCDRAEAEHYPYIAY